MNLIELIEKIDAIQIFSNIEYQPFNRACGELFIVNSNEIKFWNEARLFSFECAEDEAFYLSDKKLESLFGYKETYVYGNLYRAVYATFYSISVYRGIAKSNDQAVIWTKSYINDFKEMIKESLDFTEIHEMEEIVEIIKTDNLLGKYYYMLNVYDSAYNSHSVKREKFTFGNRKYFDNKEKMSIDIYTDRVDISITDTGQTKTYPKRLEGGNQYKIRNIISLLRTDFFSGYYNF